jgi:hypothetical protein
MPPHCLLFLCSLSLTYSHLCQQCVMNWTASSIPTPYAHAHPDLLRQSSTSDLRRSIAS